MEKFFNLNFQNVRFNINLVYSSLYFCSNAASLCVCEDFDFWIAMTIKTLIFKIIKIRLLNLHFFATDQ